MKPWIYEPKALPTIWMDYRTGKGRTSGGHRIDQPIIQGRRKTPTLADILTTADRHLPPQGNGWVMLTGKVPATPKPGDVHWLDADTPGWTHGNHWTGGGSPTGRYRNTLSGRWINLTTADAWFSTQNLTPDQLADAWHKLTWLLHAADDRMSTPLQTPGATGKLLWAFTVRSAKRKSPFDPDPLDDFTAELVHNTSGQHHIEHLVAGRGHTDHDDCLALIDPKQTPRLDGFAHVDGRFMYAALCAELGVGPVRELRRQDAADLLYSDGGIYAKARYRVRFTIPDWWDHVGILPVKYGDPDDDTGGWVYPNRPGATAETWADHREIAVALDHGWTVHPLEAIVFTDKARPCDAFADAVRKLRSKVAGTPEVDPAVRTALSAALRNLLLHTIGGFAGRGPLTEYAVDSPNEVPDGHKLVQRGDRFIYRERAPMDDRARSYYHPELAAQIWGRGRARVLSGPAAGGLKSGALTMDPSTLIGLYGDAIFSTTVPRFALPVERGGGDDGREGRLRLQGWLDGPVPTPTTMAARVKLSTAADAAGADGYDEDREVS